jgi:hypothetical protein
MAAADGAVVPRARARGHHEVDRGTVKHTCSALLAKQHLNAACQACRLQDGVVCTCPDWWFPLDRRVELRRLPHGLGGVLAHHAACAKTQVKKAD